MLPRKESKIYHKARFHWDEGKFVHVSIVRCGVPTRYLELELSKRPTPSSMTACVKSDRRTDPV